MSKEGLQRMAREADAYADGMDVGGKNYIGLRDEYFAALIEAAKEAEFQERLRTDVHSCGPTCQRVVCVAVREAVQAECEACAIAGGAAAMAGLDYVEVAAAIRARRKNEISYS